MILGVQGNSVVRARVDWGACRAHDVAAPDGHCRKGGAFRNAITMIFMPAYSMPWRMRERGYYPLTRRMPWIPGPESLEPRPRLTGKPVVYHTPYSPKYAVAGDGSLLTDGLRETGITATRPLAGLARYGCRSVVDPGERRSVKRIAADFMQGFYADI